MMGQLKLASEESLTELRESITLATRPIVVQLMNVERKVDDITTILLPIPQQIVKLETQVDGLDKYKASHEISITGLTGKMQHIEIALAHSNPSTKYLIGLIVSVVSASMAFLGYKLGS